MRHERARLCQSQCRTHVPGCLHLLSRRASGSEETDCTGGIGECVVVFAPQRIYSEANTDLNKLEVSVVTFSAGVSAAEGVRSREWV
jgi:hypothetical protein